MIERILKLIDSSGLSDSAMCKELNLGNGIIGKWRKGIQKPSTDAIIKLSIYFKVSTDYLLLGMEKAPTKQLSVEDREIISLFRRLPPEKKEVFKARLDSYVEACEDYSITTPCKQAK